MHNAPARRPAVGGARRGRQPRRKDVPVPEPAVLCTSLEKVYRDFWGRPRHPALRGIDLRVEEGESHALLGPNGSGKTTTLRLLLGLLRPTRGEVRLFGRPPVEPSARRGVGFLPEQSSLPAFLTCRETVELFARLHGRGGGDARRAAESLLERVELADAAKKKVRELSLGMTRRLALAASLAGAPRLLVLDEPTAGMDPIVREGVLGLFREHVARGGTLLVTSHLLGDLSGIATSATLLADGRVVRRGDLESLLRREGERTYRAAAGPSADAAVRAAVESAGGTLLEAGASKATIEQLFLETYRESGRGAGSAGDPGPGEGGGAAPPRGR